MTVLYMVRHAHATWSLDEDRPLSDVGRRDASRVADVLSRFPVESIYSSPYRRAWQTIAPLASRLGLPIARVGDLRERRLSYGPVADFDEATRETWDAPDTALPGGESNTHAQVRGVAAVRKIAAEHANGHVVVSTHGALLALILQHFDGRVGYEFWQSMTVPDVYRIALPWRGESTIDRLWDGVR